MEHNIAVIGAGTMGNGIAHTFAMSGYQVQFYDLDQSSLDKAMTTIAHNLERQVVKNIINESQKFEILSRNQPINDLERAVSNVLMVVEAITENETIKLELYRQLDKYSNESTILASNTSSISIEKLAAATNRPDKVIGMHFMNPVPVMKLVEVVKSITTSTLVVANVTKIAIKLGKTPVLVNDYAGFIANRVLMPMINEAIHALHEGVSDVEGIDTIMKLGMAHPMGPLQLADFIGLDVCHSILKIMEEGLGQPKYSPCPLLSNMVTAKMLGRKTGEGFYKYDGKNMEVSPIFAPRN